MPRLVGWMAALLGCASLATPLTPAQAMPPTPPPTVHASMTTAAGEGPAPLVTSWQVTRPGLEATLSVVGTTLPEARTRVVAVWTSVPLSLQTSGVGIGVALSTSSAMAGFHTAGEMATLRFRFARGSKEWGAWTHPTILRLPAAGTVDQDLDLWYDGRVPVSNLRVQAQLVDVILNARAISQTLHICRC